MKWEKYLTIAINKLDTPFPKTKPSKLSVYDRQYWWYTETSLNRLD